MAVAWRPEVGRLLELDQPGRISLWVCEEGNGDYARYLGGRHECRASEFLRPVEVSLQIVHLHVEDDARLDALLSRWNAPVDACLRVGVNEAEPMGLLLSTCRPKRLA